MLRQNYLRQFWEYLPRLKLTFLIAVVKAASFQSVLIYGEVGITSLRLCRKF